ncbi:MAG: GNAT family N-acetyltransferase [Candidatus Didemnitutus sp.]|nr:GNAT family N-acetyltransferase [Candidatus Didemnitutus sp.]
MSSTAPLHRPEPIGSHHQVVAFDCGAPALNEFLTRHALANHLSGSAKTFVATTDRHVAVGYYSLAASQILYADAPTRLQKGVARHPIPVVLLARLAVDLTWQGKGLGPGLLKDAILRVLSAAEGIGVRALLVHAKDDRAKAFYLHYDFEALPGYPLHLVLLLKDARQIVAK